MIAFVINELDICGGTHKQFLKLLDYAEKRGVDFVVVTRSFDLAKTYPGFGKYEDRIRIYVEKNIHTGNILKDKVNWILNKIALRKLVKGCDTVNIHDNGWTFDLPAFRGKKVYWQINDLPYWYAQGAHSSLAGQSGFDVLRNKTSRNLKYVTDITVNVGKNAERVKKYLGRDARVFYCGIEPVEIKRDIRDTFGRFKTKKVNLLSSGVFFKYRNYEAQVDAVKILVDRGYDARLSIIGNLADKDYANSIIERIKESGLQERITVEGQVDGTKFKELHAAADIFVFVNVDQSWGLAVFEAMSCGLPVVVSRSVGATEILADGENSVFVDPLNPREIAEAISALAESEDYYTKIAKAAADFCKEWTWESAYCSKMMDLMTGQSNE